MSNLPLPDGVAVQHTLYGQPDFVITHTQASNYHGQAVVQAPDDGVPYYLDRPVVELVQEAPVPSLGTEDDLPTVISTVEEFPSRAPGREKRCIAREDTCRAFHIKDSEYCYLHANEAKSGPVYKG